MTNEQILKKAIEKALKNGWDVGLKEHLTYEKLDNEKKALVVMNKFLDWRGWIFSHDFAKAFFGKEIRAWPDMPHIKYLWQHCLQQMVLEKDKLKYIEKFI